jgi:hypothetical protein
MSKELEITYPFTTSCGKNYLISFSKFKCLDDYKFDLPVINLDLILTSEVISKDNCLKLADLKKITSIIVDYISAHDVALYYYCDTKPIPHKISAKNAHKLPQEYRWDLFGTLFDNCDNRGRFVKHDIDIKDPSNGRHFISLISKLEHKTHLTKISQTVESVNDK